MLRVTFYIGLNDKDSKKQELTTVDAYKIVENIFFTLTDGATIRECRGIYKHENGEMIIENTFEVFCIEITDAQIQNVVSTCKKVLNQESIIVIRENINSEMI